MSIEEAIRVFETWLERDKKMKYADRLENIEIYNMAIEALKEQRPHGEWIEDIRSMICKVNDYYGYTDSMHMFKVLFDQKYHGWKKEGEANEN